MRLDLKISGHFPYILYGKWANLMRLDFGPIDASIDVSRAHFRANLKQTIDPSTTHRSIDPSTARSNETKHETNLDRTMLHRIANRTILERSSNDPDSKQHAPSNDVSIEGTTDRIERMEPRSTPKCDWQWVFGLAFGSNCRVSIWGLSLKHSTDGFPNLGNNQIWEQMSVKWCCWREDLVLSCASSRGETRKCDVM